MESVLCLYAEPGSNTARLITMNAEDHNAHEEDAFKASLCERRELAIFVMVRDEA